MNPKGNALGQAMTRYYDKRMVPVRIAPTATVPQIIVALMRACPGTPALDAIRKQIK